VGQRCSAIQIREGGRLIADVEGERRALGEAVRCERPELERPGLFAQRVAHLVKRLAIALAREIVEKHRDVVVGVRAVIAARARAEQERRNEARAETLAQRGRNARKPGIVC
jgi:hypothetical protein